MTAHYANFVRAGRTAALLSLAAVAVSATACKKTDASGD